MNKIVLILACCLFSLGAQSQITNIYGDPSVEILMQPGSLNLNSSGILLVTATNKGNTAIVANSLRITVSVGTDGEIMGVASGSDPRWTVLSRTTGTNNTIILTNTVGGLAQFDGGDIKLTVKGTVLSSPSTISGNIVYIVGNNPLLGGAPNTAQGNGLLQNDNSTTSLAVIAPLPVSLLSFDAKKTEAGTGSLLSWETGNERNSDRFNVERSGNGKSFDEIGTVAAAGNTDDKNQYHFNDANPLQGANYYRLKMIDLDGSSTYSQVRVLNFDKSREITLYPNPATTQVEVNGVEAGMKVILSNATGQQIAVYASEGSSLVIPMSSLAPGFYHVMVRAANGAMVSSTKLMKQ